MYSCGAYARLYVGPILPFHASAYVCLIMNFLVVEASTSIYIMRNSPVL
jgi:hypothetical protein